MSRFKQMLKKWLDKATYMYEHNIRPRSVKVLKKIALYTGIHWIMVRYRNLNHRARNAITGVIFVAPWVIGLYFFGIQPFFSSLRMSFADRAQYIIDASTQTVNFIVTGWTGRHFVELFVNQPGHVQTITSVFLDIALIVPLVMVFSLLLALMLNQDIKGKGVFRVIFFIPVILLSGSMLSYFSQYNLLSVPAIQNGTLAASISQYLPQQFADLIIGIFQLIILILWLSGVQTLIFLAGLQKNDKTIYEAAAIDGASLWDSFWKITLPGLHNLMIINIIYTTVIYANLSNNPLIGLINQTLVDVRFGRAYSSVLAWILFLIQLFVIGVYALLIKLSNRRYT